jgi:ribonuclease J
MRDSEDLMNKVRSYLKQKAASSFGAGKRVDLDQVKAEIKDDIAHILFDLTKHTPIVIPVINEIGGGQPQNIPQVQPIQNTTKNI